MATPRVAPSAILALVPFLVVSSSLLDSDCPPGKVPCPGIPPWLLSPHTCMLPGDLCDGIPDCPGVPGFTADEQNCTACSSGAVLCQKDRRCIRREWLGDMKTDCSDAEDEQNLRPLVTWHGQTLEWAPHTFRCDGLWRWVVVACDGVQDCLDGRDEGNDACGPDRDNINTFRFPVCHSGSVKCEKSEGGFDSQCVPAKKVCDGWRDCLHGEDERNCSATSTRSTASTSTTAARAVASTSSTDAVLGSINKALVDIGAVLSAMLDRMDRECQIPSVEPPTTPARAGSELDLDRFEPAVPVRDVDM